jgi:hypothetical protein
MYASNSEVIWHQLCLLLVIKVCFCTHDPQVVGASRLLIASQLRLVSDGVDRLLSRCSPKSTCAKNTAHFLITAFALLDSQNAKVVSPGSKKQRPRIRKPKYCPCVARPPTMSHFFGCPTTFIPQPLMPFDSRSGESSGNRHTSQHAMQSVISPLALASSGRAPTTAASSIWFAECLDPGHRFSCFETTLSS